MFVTMQTLIYAASRSGIEELSKVQAEFRRVYGNPFVTAAETDPHNVNETIREDINLIMPESGWKVARLIEIAREEGITYQPTECSSRVRYRLSPPV